jgi:predicted nucleic acid-binding Zn ribbon protein
VARERLKIPRRLGAILPQVVERLGLSRGLKCQEVLTLWPNAVGAQISRKTQAQNIEDGVLWVKVADSTWMQELYFLKPAIIKKLNQQIGEMIVKDIKFRLRS